MTTKAKNSQAFRLKGRLYTFTVLQVLDSNPALFEHQLKQTVAKAPNMFAGTPIILDFSGHQSNDVNLNDLCQLVRAHGMIPVAVQSTSSYIDTLAECAGLATLKGSESMDKSISTKETTEIAPTKLITSPVRSGQQIVAKGCDLVVVGSVSQGAELLADGNIHVYGTLRGRALAGISGNKDARIFCHGLQAELVSIAGFYRLSDAIDKHTKPCHVSLSDEQIKIQTLW